MLLDKYKPSDWLKGMNTALKSAKCKAGNENVGLEEGYQAAAGLINTVVKKGFNIWWAGNGGSAAICSHLSQDMLNKLGAKSFFLGDSSLMTCMSNDFGYKNIYLRPLETLARKGDLLIAISSSGNSENILLSAEMTARKQMKLITMSGLNNNNKLWQMESDLSFYVPSDLYGIVEIAHEAILHSIIESMWLTEKDQK